MTITDLFNEIKQSIHDFEHLNEVTIEVDIYAEGNSYTWDGDDFQLVELP